MRLLHTSDWHLGRLFHGVHLTEDQAHVLDQLVDLAREVRPDVVLVAGDVYDRAVPPAEAVRLLDDVLTRLIREAGAPVVLVAGNHDGPDRLSFGGRLLAGSGLHTVGRPTAEPEPLLLTDEHGPVAILPVPYCEPALAREVLADPDLADHDTALGALLTLARATIPPGARSVVVAHAFVRGGRVSESERPLTVGGAGQVAPERFQGFHYAALGHLHRPQSAGGNGRLRYSGSLLRYSFSELDHDKSVDLVELDSTGAIRLESIPLTPRRQLRALEGELTELLAGPDPGESREDYLLVRLTDRHPVLDPMGRLREIYPNVLHLERPGLTATLEPRDRPVETRRLTDRELLQSFYREVIGEPPSEIEEAAFQEVVAGLERQRREVEP